MKGMHTRCLLAVGPSVCLSSSLTFFVDLKNTSYIHSLSELFSRFTSSSTSSDLTQLLQPYIAGYGLQTSCAPGGDWSPSSDITQCVGVYGRSWSSLCNYVTSHSTIVRLCEMVETSGYVSTLFPSDKLIYIL